MTIVEIIDQPLIELENLENGPHNEEIFSLIQELRAALKTGNLVTVANRLRELLNKPMADLHNEKTPYYQFLLSRVLNSLGNVEEAVTNIDNSALGFKRLGSGKDQQQALSFWFSGLLHCVHGEFDIAKEQIETSLEIFAKLDKKQHVDGIYSDRYQYMIRKIKSSETELRKTIQKQGTLFGKIKNTFAGRPSENQSTPSGPQSTPLKFSTANTGEHTGGNTPPLPPPENGISPNNKRSDRRHIIIPVDLDAIEFQDLNSIPLEPEHLAKFTLYEMELRKNNSHEKRIVIPGLPIHGKTGASKTGEPQFNEPVPDMANEVDESLRIEFYGKAYHIEFLEKTTTSISKGNGKRYGWLEVEGNSMEGAHPITINNGDFALFYSHHDFKNCVGKIVIASLPDLETQVPQLVIKRLVKISENAYVLRSETSKINNPKDITIDKNEQFSGEVVAIAKPILRVMEVNNLQR